MGTLAQADIINMDDGGRAQRHLCGHRHHRGRLRRNTYGIQVGGREDQTLRPAGGQPENAVYARMISERNQMAEKYTADGNYDASIIRNDVDKQVNIIVSNAKAEAAQAGGGGRG